MLEPAPERVIFPPHSVRPPAYQQSQDQVALLDVVLDVDVRVCEPVFGRAARQGRVVGGERHSVEPAGHRRVELAGRRPRRGRHLPVAGNVPLTEPCRPEVTARSPDTHQCQRNQPPVKDRSGTRQCKRYSTA